MPRCLAQIPDVETFARENMVTAGTTFGRYQLIEQIGAGGMGQVWKAADTKLGRTVALKFLRQDLGGTSRERFRREALVLSRLSHPGVATIFDFDSQDGSDFLVMEYVPGGSLESRIAEGPLPITDVLRLGASIAAPAFALAHVEAAAGNEAEARRLLKELIDARESRVVSSYGIAALHVSLGDIDEAFRWFDIAVDEGAPSLLMLRVHPRLDPIRKDPRYWPLVEKVGLAD